METANDDTDGENADSGSEGDAWYAVINRAFEDLQQQFDEKVKETVESENVSLNSARADVYKELRPLYRKATVKHLLDRLRWFGMIRQDEIYKAILEAAKTMEIRGGI